MLKILVYAFLCIILLSVNMVLRQFFGAAPDLLFVLVAIYAFKGSADFLWIAFFCGLLMDIFSTTFFGTYMLSFLVVSAIINYTTSTFFISDPSIEFVSVAMTVAYLLLIGLVYIFNSLALSTHEIVRAVSPVYLTRKIWLDVILNLIFSLPVYWLSLVSERIIESANRKRNYR